LSEAYEFIAWAEISPEQYLEFSMNFSIHDIFKISSPLYYCVWLLMILVKKGAEANICIDKGKKIIVKDRVKKGYRVDELDTKIRKMRTKTEAKLLIMARKAGVLAPKVISSENSKISMEYIPGKRLKDAIDSKNYKCLMESLGHLVAALHANDIIHGDLTTSNFIIEDDGKRIYVVDFGLGCIDKSLEKKAVDLHLFEEAFESTHSEIGSDAVKVMLEAYRKNYADAGDVLERLEIIRKRGRYVKDR